MKLIAFILLLLTVCANAAIITIVPGDNARAKINAAQSGDTVKVLGSFTLDGSVNLKAKLTAVLGTATINTNGNTISVFSGSGIEGIRISGSGTNVNAPNKIVGCVIQNNIFSGWTKYAINATSGSDGLIIEHNGFENSPNSDRTINTFNDDNLSYSYNTLFNVHDGGHIDGTHHHTRVIGNVGRRLQRMGLELQDQNSNGGDDIEVSGNVFTDWRSPDGLSFGLSIMPQRHTNVRVFGNYIDTGKIVNGVHTEEAPGGTSKHYGYGIEWGVASGLCSNNTLVGSWVEAITSAMHAGVQGNKHYGVSPSHLLGQSGSFGTEPGLGGHGTFNDLGGNVNNPDASKAPLPPGATTKPTDPVDPAPVTVSVTAIGDHEVTVTIQGAPSASVKFTNDTGAIDLGTVTVKGSATVTNLPKGWNLIATPAGGKPIAFKTTSTTGGDWPWTGKVAIKTAPPPLTDYSVQFQFKNGVPSFTVTSASDPVVSVVVTHRSGKSETATAVSP